MRWLVLIFIALGATVVAKGESDLATKKYEACKELTGLKLQVCQSEEFSKARLTAGSEEDAYAQSTQQNGAAVPAQWYNAPSANDGRSGGSLVDCGAEQNKCIKTCAGNGECTQKCYQAIVGCAGGAVGGTSISQSEAPDGYIIDFDDKVSKTAP